MNTGRTLFLFILVLNLLRLPAIARDEFDFQRATPEKKSALPVSIKRNPFQISAEAERPLPVLKDRDDPAAKFPAVLTPHIRAVLRQPRPLLLLDSKVFQPGDEIHFGSNSSLEKFLIVLRAIENDRLVFHLTSLDPQQPGQIECVVTLGREMRKD